MKVRLPDTVQSTPPTLFLKGNPMIFTTLLNDRPDVWIMDVRYTGEQVMFDLMIDSPEGKTDERVFCAEISGSTNLFSGKHLIINLTCIIVHQSHFINSITIQSLSHLHPLISL